MPKPLRLLRDGGDNIRMAVTEPGHRNPAGEIEKFAAVGRIKIRAFAPFDGNIPPTVGRHNGWYHGLSPGGIGRGHSARTQLYRRRRCSARTARRSVLPCRPTLPGSPFIALSLGASGVAWPPHPSSRKAAEYEEGYSACQFARKPVPRRLLDDLVGTSEDRGRDREAYRLGGVQVQLEKEFCRLLDRQIGRLGAS